MEEELKTRVEAWEKDRGSDFLVWGQKVMTYITKQWEEHRQQRDKEKSERVSWCAHTHRLPVLVNRACWFFHFRTTSIATAITSMMKLYKLIKMVLIKMHWSACGTGVLGVLGNRVPCY